MAGVDGRDSDSHVCALIPILRLKSVCLSFLEQMVKFVPFSTSINGNSYGGGEAKNGTCLILN